MGGHLPPSPGSGYRRKGFLCYAPPPFPSPASPPATCTPFRKNLYSHTILTIQSSCCIIGVDISVYRAGFTQYTYSLRQGIQKLLEDRVNKILFSETGCTKLFEAGLTKYSLGQGLPKYLKKSFCSQVSVLRSGFYTLCTFSRTRFTKVARG